MIHTADGEAAMEASSDAIHSALYPEGNIDYGTTFSLESLNGISLAAICISGIYLPPKQEGEFLLALVSSVSYRECSKRFTRSEIAGYLNKFLCGDGAWINNLDWNEI